MTEQYAVLSEFYDRLMEDIPYDKWVNFYLACFEKYGIVTERILDLACGTGNITLPLAARGFDITGIDRSTEMLSLARKKADDRNLHLCLSEQNIASFDGGGKYDAVICSFDGINYLTQKNDVCACFARVYDSLADGGIFIFDISTPYKYREILADHAYVYDYDDLFVSWQNLYREKSRLCDFYLTFFVKGTSGWHRFDEIQRQRCYSPRTLETILADTGFSSIEKVADTDFSPVSEKDERCFFICRKSVQGDESYDKKQCASCDDP